MLMDECEELLAFAVEKFCRVAVGHRLGDFVEVFEGDTGCQVGGCVGQ